MRINWFKIWYSCSNLVQKLKQSPTKGKTHTHTIKNVKKKKKIKKKIEGNLQYYFVKTIFVFVFFFSNVRYLYSSWHVTCLHAFLY